MKRSNLLFMVGLLAINIGGFGTLQAAANDDYDEQMKRVMALSVTDVNPYVYAVSQQNQVQQQKQAEVKGFSDKNVNDILDRYTNEDVNVDSDAANIVLDLDLGFERMKRVEDVMLAYSSYAYDGDDNGALRRLSKSEKKAILLFIKQRQAPQKQAPQKQIQEKQDPKKPTFMLPKNLANAIGIKQVQLDVNHEEPIEVASFEEIYEEDADGGVLKLKLTFTNVNNKWHYAFYFPNDQVIAIGKEDPVSRQNIVRIIDVELKKDGDTYTLGEN